MANSSELHNKVVPYEMYKLYDWEKDPELYGTVRILRFVGQSVGTV